MKRFIAKLLFIAVVTTLPVNAVRAQRQTSQETLIRNATVLTVTRGTLENTDVLLRNGKIAGVGKNLNASANARIIDGTGKFVMPGIIDCHSHSMLDTINEGTLAVTSMVRTEDVLNPTDVDLYRELAGGVTTLNLLHGSANPIGGLNYGGEDQVRPSGERVSVSGSDAGNQVCARRKREAFESAEPAGRHAPLSKHAHGR